MYQPDEMTRQDLKDAGCPDDFADICTETADYAERARLLRICRRKLLGEIHIQQKKLDRLDYLIYITEKKKEEIRNGE